MEDNKDVDALHEELRRALGSGSEEEESSGASAQEPSADAASQGSNDESGELTDEDYSKLSPRAKKRIDDLQARAEAAEQAAAQASEPSPADVPNPQDFKNVDDFLARVEDEPSRKLLENFAKAFKGEIATTLSPIEQQNNQARFEAEFQKYQGIEGLDAHKDEIRKTFMRDPSQPIKSLVGDVVTDLQLNRVKPTESNESSPNRGGQVDTSKMSLEELYDALESTRS